ncbi:hypothetical protein V5799_020033, partial [Amblyomma americanum]
HRRRRRALGGGARNSWTASRIGRRHDGSSGSASQLHWIRKRHPGGRHGAGSAIPKVADNRSTAQVPVQIVRRVPQRSSQEPALTLRKADTQEKAPRGTSYKGQTARAHLPIARPEPFMAPVRVQL